jgi:peptidoglycan hydrolase-like protein with peptidoglycan-binding domain
MPVLSPSATAAPPPLSATLPPPSPLAPTRRDAESVETIRAIQRELQLKGYQPGTADGVPGLMTRAAIMAFEHDQGLPLTGEASDRMLKTILLGAAAAPAPSPPGAVSGQGAQAVIRTVQQTLTALGYKVGEVDGQMGPDTQRAIRAFEAAARMKETGRVSGALLAQLAKVAAAQGKSVRR